ncbi:MAG: c-type cytochrome biogenesis protein CcmI [Alphaproteobacteria bacterium]|nr:MAG: c-type cytochrome biogenesis protein CcmI [Alphaproteobacteria bacterium]
MIWFWIIAGLLVVAALIALLKPLLRAAPDSADQGESVLAVFRRQLTNLDSEIAQGRLAPDEAAAVRAEITRRMLAAADQETQNSRPAVLGSAATSCRLGIAIGIAALLPAAALAVYSAVGTPAAVERGGSAAAAPATDDRAKKLTAAAEQLKARLQQEPGHVEGWVLLARTFASLERYPEARSAYSQAIALAPKEPQLHAELGELLVLAAGGDVTAEAEAEFAKAGDDPRARFYSAEAALQRGDLEAAKATLRTLLATAPAEAPWRKLVQERLAEIAPGEIAPGGQTPAAKGSGPTAQDVAAAQSMSPEERQAMIRSMVDRLAARLEQNPNDTDGWTRLAHAYDVLGESEKAQAARSRAAQVPEAGR